MFAWNIVAWRHIYEWTDVYLEQKPWPHMSWDDHPPLQITPLMGTGSARFLKLHKNQFGCKLIMANNFVGLRGSSSEMLCPIGVVYDNSYNRARGCASHFGCTTDYQAVVITNYQFITTYCYYNRNQMNLYKSWKSWKNWKTQRDSNMNMNLYKFDGK